MELLQCHLKCLSRDLLTDIMVRLDGSTLASAACTCSDLQGIAREQSLWKQLCHSTWPSTALKEAQHLISSSAIDGFDRFYADSYPLILHDKVAKNIPAQTHISPSNFASFVDVYYSDQCILSRVLDGIPSSGDFCEGDETSDLMRWLLNCPFKLVLLDVGHDEGTGDGNELHRANNQYGYHRILAPPFMSFVQTDHCKELREGLRLSWVLLDKMRGRAVNLSSWKPLLVKKIWATDGDYEIHFGCIVPVEESVLPHKLAKCLILARCNLAENGHLGWKEISMHFEDTRGAYVCGNKSLTIMNQALYCLRSNSRLIVEKGYQQFEELKQEMIRKKKLKETIADWLCLSFEVAIFITFGYYILPI
ncbi:hypothetical protein QUC31_008457 [Theobroma cacao]|uniref:F-box protein At3g44326 n=2 Tax=Theobroma cacao TaxID=3641 RepID=A0AB32VFN8_THECC|nr:PREDICTED: F-box protein At3g44326 [Theobroma cacao]EOY23817.1 F-box family protein, putative [Theobroma cacao]